jgi:anhydro-N-acetylmuramic acid kinase
LLAELTASTSSLTSQPRCRCWRLAPLVPAFHQHLFGRPDTGVLASTFGGIANLSVCRAVDAKALLPAWF